MHASIPSKLNQIIEFYDVSNWHTTNRDNPTDITFTTGNDEQINLERQF